ncbi:hypothetical protein OG806_39975 [Streptomyces sp. NBC_00882]|uniref:hypothetical protein n=1 Tax=Streptomyces TaxID=1883 RepID=UPI003427656B|nr:hypothetical protein OG806_39975 [Streptomyces sp. NBC_00882]WSZ62108.1 hypothetical protein OH824_38890 [Streptomyces canus]
MTTPAALDFRRLPVEPDEGLPQAFGCLIGATAYEFGLYASLDPPGADPPETLYDLAAPAPSATPAAPSGYLVLRVVRQGPHGPRTVLLRKLVAEPELVHSAGELAIRLVTAKVARGNLNGRGHFGTEIVIGVAQRWV